MHQKHRASRATNNNKYKFNNNTTTDSKDVGYQLHAKSRENCA
jgi:hypothetical protein